MQTTGTSVSNSVVPTNDWQQPLLDNLNESIKGLETARLYIQRAHDIMMADMATRHDRDRQDISARSTLCGMLMVNMLALQASRDACVGTLIMVVDNTIPVQLSQYEYPS